jgi:hypothetical protein
VAAHYLALRTEKGKARVGANADIAQITTKEWEIMRDCVIKLSDVVIEDLKERGASCHIINTSAKPNI